MKNKQRIFSNAFAAFFITFSVAAQAEEGTLFMQDKNCGVAELRCGGIRVTAWAWGASLPTQSAYANSAGARAQPKTNPGTGSGLLSIATPRIPVSGLATDQRPSCVPGAHFAAATFMLPKYTYTLSDVSVASCSEAGMSLRYKTIKTLTPTEMRSTINRNTGAQN
jgi:hypothetical protein